MSSDEKYWEKVIAQDGQIYWWNTKTNETQLEEPTIRFKKPESESSGLPPPPPPPQKRAVGSTSTGKLAGIVNAGQNIVKTNSVRLAKGMTLQKKDEQTPKKNENGAVGQLSPSIGSSPSNADPGTWEARRKKSIQGVMQGINAVKLTIQGPQIDPNTIEGHLYQKAKETNRNVNEIIQNVEISKPYDVEKKLQVSFNEDNLQFEGLPDQWVEEAHRQFGVALVHCPRTQVDGYEDRIPIILCILRNRFIDLGGLIADGVFRLAPDGKDVADVKFSINTGDALKSLQSTHDPHVVANLIKQFFRELQPKILNGISKEAIVEMSQLSNFSQLGERIQKISEPQRSTFLWLLDLLSDVAQNQDINRMTPTNLAIVISPNLYDAPNMEPIEELVLSQKVAGFITNCLKWRIEQRDSERH